MCLCERACVRALVRERGGKRFRDGCMHTQKCTKVCMHKCVTERGDGGTGLMCTQVGVMLCINAYAYNTHTPTNT